MLAAGQECFGGNTAPVGAGPTPEALFHDGNLGTIMGRLLCHGMAAGACPDHNDIKYFHPMKIPRSYFEIVTLLFM
jgi:hypothetical protein